MSPAGGLPRGDNASAPAAPAFQVIARIGGRPLNFVVCPAAKASLSIRMTGIVLLNLGSPAAPRYWPVRRYLREFLADGRVIDIPAFGRWLLLQLVILPFRPRRTAALYRKIWRKGEPGSPLIFFSRALEQALRRYLEERAPGRYRVVTAMRYGQPSVAAALAELDAAGVTALRVLPLYPQYSPASTGTGLAEIYRVAGRFWDVPALECIHSFFDHPAYVKALAALARRRIAAQESERGRRIEHVLFSFHGVPERQIKKSDPGAHCLATADCCERPAALHRCYRAQCFATARALAAELGLPAGEWTVSFQSRLGRTPWIKPYSDQVIPQLVAGGVKEIAVLSPSFTADCLETLEEIALQGREQFLACGGEGFLYIPCLNDDPDWVRAVAEILGL